MTQLQLNDDPGQEGRGRDQKGPNTKKCGIVEVETRTTAKNTCGKKGEREVREGEQHSEDSCFGVGGKSDIRCVGPNFCELSTCSVGGENGGFCPVGGEHSERTRERRPVENGGEVRSHPEGGGLVHVAEAKTLHPARLLRQRRPGPPVCVLLDHNQN